MFKAMIVVALLAAPALADSKTVTVTCTLTQGKDSRHYAVKVLPGTCGNARGKTPQVEDDIQVCIDHDAANDIRLDVNWRTAGENREARNHSIINAQLGQTIEIDSNGTKLAIALQ